MEKCVECGKEFLNNLGGQLTNHLKKEHNLSLMDYIIKLKYNGIAPKCKCGLCDEIPFFNRGKFSKYALGHDKFENRKKLYLKKHIPKCLNCNKEIKIFKRGMPNKFCSSHCSGKFSGGFSKEETQNKIKKIILDKYNVENVSNLESVKQKIGKSNSGKRKGVKLSNNWRKNISNCLIKRWENDEYKIRTSKAIKDGINSNKNEINRRKEFQINRLKEQEYLSKVYGKFFGRKSKLHKKIREILELEKMGFKSEQPIYPYFVDELNEKERIIIEINGDYVHANPKKYNEQDIIVMPRKRYTAKTKWEEDEKRIDYLEQLGYKIIVIWESDNLNEIKKVINGIVEY